MTRSRFLAGRLVALSALLLLAPAPARADDAEEGFVPLFDGKSLDGWRKVGGGATYHVEGDAIVGEVGPGANTFLRTEKTYGDFVLKLDARLDVPGNSGIQLRSHQRDGDGTVFGYQCEIDPSPRAWTAGLYDESRRGWLEPLTGHPEAQGAYKKDAWNAFVIEARGPHIRTRLNGVPCADVLDTMDLDGFLALQVHAGKEGRIRWRNIRIKDLGTSRWRPLTVGKDLAGWTPAGGGRWAAEDGAIRGTNTSSEPRDGFLVAGETARDFALRLKFRDRKGGGGLVVRAEGAGAGGLKGLRAEIDPAGDVGGLHDAEGGTWLARPKPEDVKKALKPDGWNELSVVALGDRVAVLLNGQKTAEAVVPEPRESGRIALQLRGGQDVDLEFRDIDILPIDREARRAPPR